MAKDYGSWPLAALKAELRKRNAKVTGRKAILVKRLLDYDNMFGDLINDPDAAYRISAPGPEHFLDINSNTILPKLNELDINAYSILGERDNLESSKKMYDECYLLTSRVAQCGDDFFITAVCAAEMRKNVTYNTTIKYQDNMILEAQCECAAGMGPYSQCKHVIVVMYGLADFTICKEIKVRSSPTANLQTFHHPSSIYTGTPIEANKLKLRNQDENLKRIIDFDPRPSQPINKEKYRETFCQKLTNFATQQSSVMPINQLIKPANKMALFKDHDYLEETAENKFLDGLHLSDEQIDDLEKNSQLNKKIWQQERLKRLQSSNFGKICKSINNQKKMAKSFLKHQDFKTLAMKHGIKYEPAAIKKFTETSGLNVQKCGIFVNREFQFLASTPDGIVGQDSVLEVKCPFTAKDKMISPETVPYLYLCEKSGQLKLNNDHDYYYQIQGQMLCTRRRYCYFCVYTICDFYIIKVDHNEEFQKNMLSKLKTFYYDNYLYYFLCRYLYNIKF